MTAFGVSAVGAAVVSAVGAAGVSAVGAAGVRLGVTAVVAGLLTRAGVLSDDVSTAGAVGGGWLAASERLAVTILVLATACMVAIVTVVVPGAADALVGV